MAYMLGDLVGLVRQYIAYGHQEDLDGECFYCCHPIDDEVSVEGNHDANCLWLRMYRKVSAIEGAPIPLPNERYDLMPEKAIRTGQKIVPIAPDKKSGDVRQRVKDRYK